MFFFLFPPLLAIDLSSSSQWSHQKEHITIRCTNNLNLLFILELMHQFNSQDDGEIHQCRFTKKLKFDFEFLIITTIRHRQCKMRMNLLKSRTLSHIKDNNPIIICINSSKVSPLSWAWTSYIVEEKWEFRPNNIIIRSIKEENI